MNLPCPSARRGALLVLLACLAGVGSAAARADETLVVMGATWAYLDDGSDQGTAWRAPGFDDTAWAAGPGQLGYGDGDEATVVGFGPDPAFKHVTTYFRHAFSVVDASVYVGFTLSLLRDDGAVIYLNGVEVARSNMPAGVVTHVTPALAVVGGADESTPVDIPLPEGTAVDGENVLAVEVHQATPSSSDLSFDLALVAHTDVTILRGPYLQQATADSVVVRWRTNVLADARVRYGLAPGSLDTIVDVLTPSRDHEVPVAGLAGGSTFFYSVGTTSTTLDGDDAAHFFRTLPPPGGEATTRIWVLGDSGTANADAAAVREDYLAYAGGTSPDVWLMLGDNAYPTGTDEAYQAAVFDMYPDVLANTVLWPTPGNHDAEPLGVSTSAGTGPYFDLFTLPGAGEAGGVASGTEAYYSFDHGDIHFISLNSTGSDRSPGSTMLTWLALDLAATDREWVVAYWHHPPYTRGSHDSDNPQDSEGRMFDMREHVLPILESGGVDLVLTGHSHSYERSVLVHGHYGVSSTLVDSMVKDPGDGRVGGDGPYHKQPEGTVYVVAGSSGQASGGPLDHPVMLVSLSALGSVVIDVAPGRLDAVFLSAGQVAGSFTIDDSFTIEKAPDCFLETSAPIYGSGEVVELSTFVVRNPGPASKAVEAKVWLEVPGLAEPVSLVSLGARGTFVVPARDEQVWGPIPLLPVNPGTPAGEWRLGCRVVEPATARTWAEDVASFQVVVP